jgi:hypothetical protein
MFSLPVLDLNRKLLKRAEIFSNLKNIVQNTTDVDELGLGIMTSETRDTWAETYDTLIKGN